MTLIKMLLRLIRLDFIKYKWRELNKHNFTVPGNRFILDRVSVGNATYGTLNVINSHNKNAKLNIGNYCYIAEGVTFLLSGEHNYINFSTYPFLTKIFGEPSEAITKGPINICDDVWIGQNALILSGVTLGQGCIIGAGTIVAKDIPPYAIYAGGKIIKFRFTDEIIEKLMRIDFAMINSEFIKKHKQDLYSTDIQGLLSTKAFQELMK